MKKLLFITLFFSNYNVKAQGFNPSPAEYQRWLQGSQYKDISKEVQERYNQKSRSSNKEEILNEILLSKMDKEDYKSAITVLDLLISNGYNNRKYYFDRGVIKIYIALKNNTSKTASCSDFRKAMQLGNPEAKKYVNDYCLVK